MDDPNLWAMDYGPVYPGSPDYPVLAHLIARRCGPDGEVRVAACGLEFRASSRRRGWWSTRSGRFPLQDHAIHCGRETILGQQREQPADNETA